MERNWRNYFEIKGKKYYTGTVIVVNDLGKKVEATFICYDMDYNRYVYQVKNTRVQRDEELFYKVLISVTDKVNCNVKMPMIKQKHDCDIDGLFIGWVWYIFLMLISFIFKEVIGLWIFISIVFFSWRSTKIKKEGNYVEW